MAYGKLKADALIRDNGGSDEEITMATIVGLDANKANLSGATFTGDVLLDNEQELRLGEADANGTNYVALKSPATLAQTSTWTMPADVPVAGQVLKVTSVANTNDPTLEWGADASGASVSAENTWTAGQRGEITTVASGTTITIDFDASNNFTVDLGHNVTTVAISNATVGQSGSIFLAQPTSGSTTHTVGGWNSAFKFPGGTAPTLSTAINKVDRIDYVIRATNQIHVVATLDMAV